MRRSYRALTLLLSIGLLTFPSCVPAQNARTGFVADYLNDLNEVETKLLSLAEAVPEAKYDWRPAAGVRSVGEVYAHVSEANGFMPKLLGQPESHAPSSSLKTKAEITAALRQSFLALRKAAEATPDSALNRNINFFGQSMSEQELLMANLSHLHEHLGQSIAYARVNGIPPPWSKKAE